MHTTHHRISRLATGLLAAVAAMAVLVAGPTTATATTQPVPHVEYALWDAEGAEVVAVPASSTTPGDQLTLATSFTTRRADRAFRFVPVGDGYHRIETSAGLCVDVRQAAVGEADVIQWPCHGGTNQQWQVEADGGAVRLRARHSGRYLGVDDTGVVQVDRAAATRLSIEVPLPDPVFPEVCWHVDQMVQCFPWPG